METEKKYLSVEKSIRHHHTQMIKVNITNDKSFWYHVTLDIAWWEKHFTSVVFFPQIYYLGLIMWKYHTNSNWGDIQQNNWEVLFKSVKAIRDKKDWGTIMDWKDNKMQYDTLVWILKQ